MIGVYYNDDLNFSDTFTIWSDHGWKKKVTLSELEELRDRIDEVLRGEENE